MIHACLFCLSNIAAGSKKQVKRLIEEEIIINLVVQHAYSPKSIIAGESMWVLCNIVTIAKPEDRINFLRIYSSDLVHVLIHWIEYNASKAGEARVTLEVLNTLIKLLQLEVVYPDEFTTHESSVRYMIDEVAGFSAIEKLTIGDKHEQAICEKS